VGQENAVAVDEGAVRAFISLLHERAAAVTADVSNPGVLQLCRVRPDDKKFLVSRYMVGDIDRMVEDAALYAQTGHNVYCEGRLVGNPRAPGLGARRWSGQPKYAPEFPQSCVPTP
jgi:hypothetical protein